MKNHRLTLRENRFAEMSCHELVQRTPSTVPVIRRQNSFEESMNFSGKNASKKIRYRKSFGFSRAYKNECLERCNPKV